MITDGSGGVYLDLLVQPKSRHPGLRGVQGDRLKLAVRDPAEGGKANKATVTAVAELLAVPTTAVTVVRGRTSRRKRLHVEGINSSVARRIISAAVEKSSDSV